MQSIYEYYEKFEEQKMIIKNELSQFLKNPEDEEELKIFVLNS